MRREIAPEWRACVGSPYRMSTGQFCPRRCMARLVGPNRIQLGLAAITVLLGGQPRPLELDLLDVPGSAVPTPGDCVGDRKSVLLGKSMSVSEERGGGRIIEK